MMKPAHVMLAVLAALVLLLFATAPAADAATTCDAMQLTPCAGAIIGNAAPTAACCSRMKEQQPCLCTYARDPNLQRYVNSPNGKKVMATCKCSLLALRSVQQQATAISPQSSLLATMAAAGNKQMSSLALFLVVLTVASAVLSLTPGADAATKTCTPTQLTPCAPAIVGNSPPTAACCSKLKAHPATCFCQYKKDPAMKRYVNSPNGKKVFAACKVPLPNC
ncbi:hypothetical protein EJB05_36581, partial [Eragrostis curvula]